MNFMRKIGRRDGLTVIHFRGDKIGTYLLQRRGYGYYLGSFFILPKYQGRGIGSRILSSIVETLNRKHTECRLGYLQSNPHVGKLYKRFGFVIYKQDGAFVCMLKRSRT